LGNGIGVARSVDERVGDGRAALWSSEDAACVVPSEYCEVLDGKGSFGSSWGSPSSTGDRKGLAAAGNGDES